MSNSPAPANPRFGYLVIAIGVIEVAIAVAFAAFTGLTWVLLLALFTIPNFVLGYRTLRDARR